MHLGQPPADLLLRLEGQVTKMQEAAISQHLYAGALPTSWMFNWNADGWGSGQFESETRDFGNGVAVKCYLEKGLGEHLHSIGYSVTGLGRCRVHVTLSVLDKNGRTLRDFDEVGTSTVPAEVDFSHVQA